MGKRFEVRRIIPALLLAIVFLLTSCSYNTIFVVVNVSDQPIDVRYEIRNSPGPFTPPVPPAMTAASKLHATDKEFHKLSTSEYTLDPKSRTITVRVKSNEVLLVERLLRSGMHVDNAEDAESFGINEITIVGAYGEIKFQGDQVRKSFVAESKTVFTLTYR